MEGRRHRESGAAGQECGPQSESPTPPLPGRRYGLSGLLGRSSDPLLQAQTGIGVSLGPGSGSGGIGPGQQVGHLADVLADRRPAVVGYQQTDQDREVGKSVTPFLVEKCS